MNMRRKAGEPGGRPARAFTLIEMIGVLAVLALVAGLLTSASLRHLDRIASDQETALLQTLGEALQQSILRTRNIPSYTNWAAVIAAQTGMDMESVTNNIRNRPRVLLMDSGGWLSTNLPYSQNYAGTPAPPINARVMLLSSLGKDLPVTNGMHNASAFDALWNAPPGTVPWTGWNGNPDDVKIRRVNLAPLFVNLVLSTYSSATNGQYAVLTNLVKWSQTNPVPFNTGFQAFFLKGTGLQLHSGPPYSGPPVSKLDSTQILNDDSSFVYEGGKWKASVQGKIAIGSGDIAGIVAAFLNATPNTNAYYPNGNYQQILVVSNFTLYMSNYNVWAEGNFTNATLRTHLISVQTNMMHAVRGLYSDFSSYDNYPTNSAACP
jgi:type II secretory pathway pseudopilin PulG